MSRKEILLSTVLVLAFGIVAHSRIKPLDVGTTAPTVAGVGTIVNPQSGAIVLDTSSSPSTFYGNNGTTVSPNWVALGSGSGPTANYATGNFSVGYTWSVTPGSGTTPADFANSTVGTYTVAHSNGITVTAAGSDKAGITFSPSASGNVYLVTFTTNVVPSSSTHDFGFEVSDGTTAWSTATYGLANSSDFPVNVTFVYVSSSTSAVTLRAQALASSGAVLMGGAYNQNSLEWSIVQLK